MRLFTRSALRGSFGVFLFGCLTVCAPNQPDADDLIARAKDVIANHEAEAMAGNLDGVVSNCAPDIVVLAAGAPLVEGLDGVRQFYGQLLATGSFEFTHAYSGAALVGDAVVLHGVARGTLTPPEGPPTPVENNFIMILKPDEAGVMKFWRVSFAPASM
ncbi:MAG: nuclear transport factor 2 family protein [Gemmatimonadota bacterium]